jgi:hypothetical protein
MAFILVVAIAVVFSNCAQQTGAAEDPVPAASVAGEKHPVLVELFTSEGCSSCPPADRALALLERQQPVSSADTITLEFHVDYWDGPGWKDPFSSALFTQRQEQYAAAFRLDADYTPQMIVDGQKEFVGSELGKATSTIEKLAGAAKGKIVAKASSDSIKIAITQLPVVDQATVYLAAVEDNLTSNVSGGENAGEKLAHTSVVHELAAIGVIEKGKTGGEFAAALPSNPIWKKDNLRQVVFVQDDKTRKILAVARVSK